ncbi:MAG: hypothetical protein J6A01_00970, partial [Proteobacteria bacterium]|nr:hypothetical protein [Pseudomonadota bacterium]
MTGVGAEPQKSKCGTPGNEPGSVEVIWQDIFESAHDLVEDEALNDSDGGKNFQDIVSDLRLE